MTLYDQPHQTGKGRLFGRKMSIFLPRQNVPPIVLQNCFYFIPFSLFSFIAGTISLSAFPPSFCQFLFFLLIKEYLRYPSHPSVHCEFLFPLPSSHFSYSFRHHIHKQRSFDMGTGDRQTANDRTNKIAPVLCLSFHALVKVAQIPVHRPIFIFSSRVSSFPSTLPVKRVLSSCIHSYRAGCTKAMHINQYRFEFNLDGQNQSSCYAR